MEMLDRFEVTLEVTIRPCRREDLPSLEWWGVFAGHRDLIRETFERHLRGEAIMLVAEAGGVASGQAWVDLDRGRRDGTAVFWAARVFPSLQNLGIGRRLVLAAERLARARGFRRMEMTVRTDNPGARRLYERLGYRPAGEVKVELRHEEASSRQQLLRKELSGGPGGGRPTREPPAGEQAAGGSRHPEAVRERRG